MTSGDVLTSQIPFLDLAPMTMEVRDDVERGWARVLATGRFIGGDEVAKFEAAWASYCQVPHAIGVANGTDALQLTLTGLGIGAGDEVIVPANTFVATAEAVLLAGAVPRFADVSPQTLLLTPECLEAALTPRTAAVIVVHLYGQMPDMGALCAAADRAGIALIEDAAQAHGATWQRPPGRVQWGRPAASASTRARISGAFGDAGAVVTTDADLAGRIRVLRDHGRAAGSHYRHELAGTNSRLDAMQAVVLMAKLARLEAWNAARRSIAARYHAALADTAARLVTPVQGTWGVHHLAVVRVPARTQVSADLAAMGVQTQVHYPIPCHRQVPYLRFADGPLPVAEHCADEVLSLPMFPHMTDDQVEHVCAAAVEVLQGKEHQVA